MKIKYLLSVIISSLLMINLANAAFTPPSAGTFTQGLGDTIVIAPNIPGNLETVINNDITGAVRNDINRVYVLQSGLYEQNAGLDVVDSTGTLSIVGVYAKGKQRPVWYKNEINSSPVAPNVIEANFTLKNVQYEGQDMQGAFPAGDNGDFVISTLNKRVELDNNFIEFSGIACVNGQAVAQGFKFIAKGNYFRNFFLGAQWWAGRVLYAKVPLDTLIFENNAVTSGGLTLLEQNSLTAFLLVDHNTFVNNIKYLSPNPFNLESYWADNLFVNCGIAGEDSINIMNGQDVDHIRNGIIQIDTIATATGNAIGLSSVQPRYLTSKGVADPTKVGLSNIIFYAAENIAAADTTTAWVKYMNGEAPFADGIVDSAASYLTWTGKTPPYGVTNFKQVLYNQRAIALAKGNKHIMISNDYPNIQYQKPANTYFANNTWALDTERANFFIQWNRSSDCYSVPNVTVPVDYNGITLDPSYRFNWGDDDPTTFPGPGNKEVKYTSAKGGITAFTDLPENFTSNVKSNIDGTTVGSLIWTGTTINTASELTAIKAAYSKDEPLSVAVGSTSVNVSSYPNPFTTSTTIEFSLPKATHATLNVVDLSGKVISTLVNENLPAGTHVATFTTHANGLFIVELTTDESVVTAKIIKN